VCPRVMDDSQVKHEESPSGKPTRRRGRDQPPEFTLGGLLAFFTAITVCISLAATGARVMKIDFRLGNLLFNLTWVVTWIVLYVTYRKLRLRDALILHWGGLALVMGLVLLLIAMGLGRLEVGWLVVALLSFACGGCAVGSALSVPVFVVTMVVRLARGATGRPRSRQRLPPGSD